MLMKKNVIRITAVFLAIVTVLLIVFISSCNNRSKKTDEDIKDATFDEIVESVRDDAIENSDNVNGARFNSTLLDFTQRYNEAKKSRGENTDLIMEGKWKKNGDESSDDNGVKIQYYYYDEENTNFTATVEVESQKLLNIGFGTTMSYYMGQTDEINNSELALEKAALMAQAVCHYKNDSTDVLKEVFRQTTADENGTLWFQQCVYKLDTQQDKKDSKNDIMLFRVFPISDRLKAEWKLKEYDP